LDNVCFCGDDLHHLWFTLLPHFGLPEEPLGGKRLPVPMMLR
jgi:hypothetical protein